MARASPPAGPGVAMCVITEAFTPSLGAGAPDAHDGAAQDSATVEIVVAKNERRSMRQSPIGKTTTVMLPSVARCRFPGDHPFVIPGAWQMVRRTLRLSRRS